MSWSDGLIKPDFLTEVAFGNVPGYRLVRKFGILQTASTTKQTIWSQGGDYTFPTTTPHFISSSNVNDVQPILVEGLGEDKKPKSELITLDGQNKTPIGNWYRSHRAQNKTVTSTDLLGDVYIYEDDTVVAGVPQTAGKITAVINVTLGFQQTEMAIYTTPINEEALIVRVVPGIVSRQAQAASGTLLIRELDSVFINKYDYAVNSQGTTAKTREFTGGEPVAPGSDILVDVTASLTVAVKFEFDILLRKL